MTDIERSTYYYYYYIRGSKRPFVEVGNAWKYLVWACTDCKRGRHAQSVCSRSVYFEYENNRSETRGRSGTGIIVNVEQEIWKKWNRHEGEESQTMLISAKYPIILYNHITICTDDICQDSSMARKKRWNKNILNILIKYIDYIKRTIDWLTQHEAVTGEWITNRHLVRVIHVSKGLRKGRADGWS